MDVWIKEKVPTILYVGGIAHKERVLSFLCIVVVGSTEIM